MSYEMNKTLVRLAELLLGEVKEEAPGHLLTQKEAIERINRVCDEIEDRLKNAFVGGVPLKDPGEIDSV